LRVEVFAELEFETMAFWFVYLLGIYLKLILSTCSSLILREENRLRVFENRALRRIFGAKIVEVIGDWRKLKNVELQTILRMTKLRRIIWEGTRVEAG
jgi:hypothetical protein